jgi:hypothetical protein
MGGRDRLIDVATDGKNEVKRYFKHIGHGSSMNVSFATSGSIDNKILLLFPQKLRNILRS